MLELTLLFGSGDDAGAESATFLTISIARNPVSNAMTTIRPIGVAFTNQSGCDRPREGVRDLSAKGWVGLGSEAGGGASEKSCSSCCSSARS